MTNNVSKQIASKLAVNPRILTTSGTVPVLQHLRMPDYSWL